jgi:hypothetical protein
MGGRHKKPTELSERGRAFLEAATELHVLQAADRALGRSFPGTAGRQPAICKAIVDITSEKATWIRICNRL